MYYPYIIYIYIYVQRFIIIPVIYPPPTEGERVRQQCAVGRVRQGHLTPVVDGLRGMKKKIINISRVSPLATVRDDAYRP